MAYVLTKRKCILCIVFIIAVSVLFSACDPRAGSYPYSNESIWECSNPKIVLEYSRSAGGELIEHCTMEWNNTLLNVDLNFRSKLFVAGPAAFTDYDDRFFSGTWKYRNGNLVLMIEEDFVFDYAYNELVFVKVNNK